MRMTEEEFDRERRYQAAMYYVRKMLDAELITEEEYHLIDTKNLEKFRPFTGTLLSGKFLLFPQNRANMAAGKEAQSLEESHED